MRASRKILILAALLTPALLAFQNCSLGTGGFESGNSQSSKPAGNGNNGEGYTGKVYVNYDVASTCPSGDVKNQVELKDGKYLQTIADCAAQTPVDVTSQIEAAGHNDSAIFSGPVLFESLSKTQTVYSEVVCRGEGSAQGSTRKGMADVSMQPTGEVEKDSSGNIIGKIYKGYVKVGEYDLSGGLLNSKEFSIKRAVERTMFNGTRHFVIDSETSSNTVQNSAPPAPGTVKDESYGLIVKPDNVGAFVFKTEAMSEALMVPAMTCHFHQN